MASRRAKSTQDAAAADASGVKKRARKPVDSAVGTRCGSKQRKTQVEGDALAEEPCAEPADTARQECSAEPSKLGGSALRHGVESAEGRIALAAELLRIRTKIGGVEPLRANPAQLLFEQRHGRESIVLKARQMGLSTWIAGRFFLQAMAMPGTVTVHVAHTREAATALFRMVGRMWANLPEDMRASQAKLLRNNAGEMVFAANDSEIRVVSAAEPNAGRGLTIHQLHVSELSRWQGDAAETLAGLRAALAPGGELVMESTPNGAFGCFYEQWVAAERNGVTRHFFPWWIEPGYVSQRVVPADSLSEEEAALITGGLRLEQIAFRRELAERYGPLRLQEFAEDAATCFRESGACVFETRVLLQRLAALPEPVERRHNGAVEIYWPPQPGRRYVVAVDSAGGREDGDFSTAQVVDRATGMQCAEMQARWNPGVTARAVAALAREYCGALLAVERNNHGAAVLAYLERESGFALYRGADGELGWLTTSASRDAMLGGLQVLLSREAALVQSRRLLLECRSFVDRNGRMEAAAGTHDDLVMAMAIAQAVRREGRKRD